MTREQMSAEEIATVNMAIGRIFRLGSRPGQEGDAAEYWNCRSAILNLLGEGEDRSPNWVRDRLGGAAGDF